MAQASYTNNTNLVAQDVTDANGFYFMWEKALSTSGTVDPETARGLIRSRASGASVAPLDSPTGGYSFDGEGDIHFSQGVQSVPLRYQPDAVIIGYDRPSPPEPVGGSTPPGTGQVTFTPGKAILVTARINERDSAQLMLDTGAARTVIHPSVLSALGVSYDTAVRGSIKRVTGDAEVLVVRVESIEVSGAKVGPLGVVSHDPGFGPGRGDGLLGRDFLAPGSSRGGFGHGRLRVLRYALMPTRARRLCG